MEDTDFAEAESFQLGEVKFCTDNNMEAVHGGIFTSYELLVHALREHWQGV